MYHNICMCSVWGTQLPIYYDEWLCYLTKSIIPYHHIVIWQRASYHITILVCFLSEKHNNNWTPAQYECDSSDVIDNFATSDIYLTHWGRVSNLGIISSDNGLLPDRRHYLNQCWDIVDWILRNKLQWNFNSCIFSQENVFKNVVWKKTAILSLPQCVNGNTSERSLFLRKNCIMVIANVLGKFCWWI